MADASRVGGGVRNWIDARAIDEAVAAMEARIDNQRPPRSAREALELALEAPRAAPANAAFLMARAAALSRIGERPTLTDAAGDALRGWPKAMPASAPSA